MYTRTNNISTPRPITGTNNRTTQNPPNTPVDRPKTFLEQLIALQIGNSAVANAGVGALEQPVIQTLQPIANLVTTINSPYFWLNAGGLVMGLILVIIAISAIMQSEIQGVKNSVVSSALGVGGKIKRGKK